MSRMREPKGAVHAATIKLLEYARCSSQIVWIGPARWSGRYGFPEASSDSHEPQTVIPRVLGRIFRVGIPGPRVKIFQDRLD